MTSKICSLLAHFSVYFSEDKYRKIASSYMIGNYKRIYFVHIRKTGGTSLNNMFLSLGGENSAELYSELVSRVDHRIIRDDRIFVGWHKRLIEKGNYFYAFSHIPLHELRFPKDTFIISCFRDPLQRVLSYYNMLVDMSVNDIKHPCMEVERKYVGDSFDDFLERVPQKHLMNQLFMFSRNLNVHEALDRARSLAYYFFTEDFDNGIETLNAMTQLKLMPLYLRKGSHQPTILETLPKKSIMMLRKRLSKEYEFLDALKSKM